MIGGTVDLGRWTGESGVGQVTGIETGNEVGLWAADTVPLPEGSVFNESIDLRLLVVLDALPRPRPRPLPRVGVIFTLGMTKGSAGAIGDDGETISVIFSGSSFPLIDLLDSSLISTFIGDCGAELADTIIPSLLYLVRD